MPILRHLYHGGDTMLPFLFLFFLLFASIIPPLSNLCRHYLAKLSKAVKVADPSNQGEAESEGFSPVTVTLGEDTKPFEKRVISTLLPGQGMILGTLFRQEGIGVYLSKSLISSIRLQLCFCLDMETRILE